MVNNNDRKIFSNFIPNFVLFKTNISIMRKKVVDDIDLLIINILQKNANITNKDLAKKIGLTPPPTLTRVNNLWKRRILSHYQAKADPTFFKFHHKSTVIFTINPDTEAQFISNIQDQREVTYCAKLVHHKIASSYKYLAVIMVKSNEHFEECLNEITKKVNVQDVEISEIDKVVKDTPMEYTSEDI